MTHDAGDFASFSFGCSVVMAESTVAASARESLWWKRLWRWLNGHRY
ncbi:hypothetical protein [Mycolicibacter virginiensis]|nr:hypothetical protein [Mycolicibacter virginiensis]ULP48348.1 hypothetical protein MJO54_04155 [Mycolicibacter virginiensis]